MFLRDRLNLVIETISETELAANRRLAESDSLLRAHRYAGAIYLLGYVAEIHLKDAVFRRLGASAADQCLPFRRLAERRARQMGLIGQLEGGHGVRFWARLLWSLPNASGSLLDPETRRSLCRHVLRVERNWDVGLRYSSDPCFADEAITLHRSVQRVRENRVRFRR